MAKFLVISGDDYSAACFEADYTIEQVVKDVENGKSNFEDFTAEIKEFSDVVVSKEFIGWVQDLISDSDILKASNFYLIEKS